MLKSVGVWIITDVVPDRECHVHRLGFFKRFPIAAKEFLVAFWVLWMHVLSPVPSKSLKSYSACHWGDLKWLTESGVWKPEPLLPTNARGVFRRSSCRSLNQGFACSQEILPSCL